MPVHVFCKTPAPSGPPAGFGVSQYTVHSRSGFPHLPRGLYVWNKGTNHSGCIPGLPVRSAGSSSGEKSYSKLISEQIRVLVTVKEVTLEAEVPSNPNLDHHRNVMFLGMILPSPCIYPFSFYLPIIYYSVHQALLGNYYLPGIIPCSQESPRRAHKLWTMFNFPFRLQTGSMDLGVCSVNICSWGDNEGTTRDWHENATGLSE